MKLSFDDEDSFKEGIGSLHFNNPPSDPDAPVLGPSGSYSSMPVPQERNEDISRNNSTSTSDPNSLQQVVSTSSNEIEVVPR